ncbi:MAG TPA: YqcC family protein [Cyclobacteriaceae bacterium]|nr:YqcC family protein [Cyclobacteriaceae bacterium]
MPSQPDYTKLAALSAAIEAELKQLGVWSSGPLDPEKLIDMGAFGSNTMAFEEWIQFILLARIREIIDEKSTLPSESMISTYAIREFDGNTDYDNLMNLLRQLDDLANGGDPESDSSPAPPLLGANVLPDALWELAKILHTLEGDYLESQLQTFDIMLPYLPAGGREQVEGVIRLATDKAVHATTRQRLERAIHSLRSGETICKPYDHEAEMKKYRDEFRKGYPDLYPEG